jgi:hypothetical protein
MYGVLYAVSSELFPAKDRGTGNGLASTTQRLFSVMVSRCCYFEICFLKNHCNLVQGPLIALYANLKTAVPVYVSGGLMLLCACLAVLLPFDPRGKASL